MKNVLTKIDSVKKRVGKISKDMENPFFKSSYFDINSLLEQIEPLLQEEGLILIQPIKGREVCTEIIDIDSLEKVVSSIELPELTDPQKMGSAITYYRRYSLASLLALQSEDDDGNLASNKEVKMVTMAQGKLLQSLGVEVEEIRKLTFVEADKKIKLLMGK
jgi:hypothetical protein